MELGDEAHGALGVEDEHWHLIGAGVGTVEACRWVGIG